MLRPVRLRRLTFFVHESVLEGFLLALEDVGVHVDEPSLVEPERPDVGDLKTLESKLAKELRERGLEAPEPGYGVEPDLGVEPGELGDGELVEVLAAVRGRLDVSEATSMLGRQGSVFVLEGWIPVGREEVLDGVVEAVDGKAAWFLDKPELEGFPPTKLDNPDFFAVPERLVRTYGVPSYFEVDPTLIVGVTFPLIFGLMYGDLGHAALLLVLAFAAARWERAPEGSRDFLLSLAATSAVFGALYGEVFGLHYFEALWFDRLDEVLFLIQVSLVVGIFHGVLGISLGGVNSFLNSRLHRVVYRFPWVVFYLLWIPAIFGSFEVMPFIVAVLVLVVASSYAISIIEGEGPLVGFLDTFRRLFDGVLHVSSYVRVAAVSLTHVVFSDLLLHVLRPGPVGFASWLLLTLLLIVFVETFFASIQTLRLHWTEWFYNFYEGEGREFVEFELG